MGDRHLPAGFPHSDISGSLLTYSSPKHFVVSHVLHRLLVPRHPPCALINLTLLIKLINMILQRFGLFLVTFYNYLTIIMEFDIDIQFSMDKILTSLTC